MYSKVAFLAASGTMDENRIWLEEGTALLLLLLIILTLFVDVEEISFWDDDEDFRGCNDDDDDESIDEVIDDGGCGIRTKEVDEEEFMGFFVVGVVVVFFVCVCFPVSYTEWNWNVGSEFKKSIDV